MDALRHSVRMMAGDEFILLLTLSVEWSYRYAQVRRRWRCQPLAQPQVVPFPALPSPVRPVAVDLFCPIR